MKPLPADCVPVPGLRFLVIQLCAALLLLLPAGSRAQSDSSAQAEPGKWIPLPYFRSGSWWLPLEVEKPVKLSARLVALAGMDCYLFTGAEKGETLVRATGEKILTADAVIPMDARHFAFSQNNGPYRLMRNDGVMMPEPAMDFQTVWNRRGQYSKSAAPKLPAATSLESSGWAVSSNSQPPVSPQAMDYNAHLGWLCVIQRVGERGLGSELRVWDVRSRCCLWTRRLPGSPNSPVGVRLLDNGLVFVNGGYGKYTVSYLHVYDTKTRQTILEKEIPGSLQLGRGRMSPLPDGQRVLSILSLLPAAPDAGTSDLGQGLRLFDMTSKTERMLMPGHDVYAVTALPDGLSALVGTAQGEVLRLDLTTGTQLRLGHVPGQKITALAVSDDLSSWAAGTRDGSVISGAVTGSPGASLSDLDGEVTGLAFFRGSRSRLAVRVAGSGEAGFYGGYSVIISKHADGVIWDVSTGERTPLPPGAGICAVDGSLLALGLADSSGTVFFDADTGTLSEPLGNRSPSVLERETYTGEGLDKPTSLRTNADGSQLFIQGKLFDFKTMRFEPLSAARGLAEPVTEAALMRPAESGPELQTDEILDALLLGPSKMPACVLLYPDPNTVAAFSGLSPSGKVAAIYSQWKGGGDLRLVDLPRCRVMSQPNQGSLTEDLQSMNFLGWVKPLDDDGHRVLAIRSNSGQVDMLDYAGGRTISRLEFGGEAAAACCSFEARRLFIATDDAAVHCVTWDDTGHLKPVGRLDIGMNDTWALTLPNGMFMSSGAERLMVLAGHGRALPLDTGAAAFHRPHEVARAFGASPEQVALLERAYLRRCQRDELFMAKDAPLDFNLLPRAVIRDRLNLPVAVREDEFRFTVEASAAGPPLTKVQVTVNGVPLHPWNPDLPAETQNWTGEVLLKLSPGTNKIQVSAADAAGRESLRETVVIWHLAQRKVPVLHLVAVGVSDYQDDDLDLVAASKDARDLVQFLTERQGREYREVRPLLLTDQQATRETILQARDFLRASQEGDEVIVFVAGHGFVDQQGLRYWFGTHDIDVHAVDKRGVSYEELESLFDGVPARQRLLLMDTCFAGEVDVESTAPLAMASGVKARAPAVASGLPKPPDGSFDLMRELFSDLRRHTGATVMTASAGMEHVYAEEREQGDNGVFTYCLLDGLRTGAADANGDGDIRLSEMQAYLLTRVPQMTGGRQQPTGRQMNANADFPLGKTEPRPPLDPRQFVLDYLSLTSENQKEKKLAALFAEPASYFGKSRTRAEIEQEERSYHQRFPQRNFMLKTAAPPSLIQSSETQCTLSFPMAYSMIDTQGNSRSGSQELSMELTRQGDGWKIAGLKVLKTEDTSPPPSGTPVAPPAIKPPPPVAQQSGLEGAVLQFLALSSSNGREQSFAALFADRVDYFGKTRTRNQIFEEELAYHQRWPFRKLTLVGPVQQVDVAAGEMLARYTMSMWKSRTFDGGDTTLLSMEMRLRQINGTWFITSMKVRKP